MSDTKRRITLVELPKQVPDYKNSKEGKDILTEKWLTSWIDNSLQKNLIQPYELLPIKQKLAYYLGISIGSVQSALRYMEDKGIVASKQKIGTYILPKNFQKENSKKLTGKRDLAIKNICEFIHDNELKKGNKLPSIRTLAKGFSLSTNTIRLAIEHLISIEILEPITVKKDNYIVVKQIPDLKKHLNVELQTLISKVKGEIFDYLKNNFQKGDKFLTHHQLAKKFNVSVKTAHDAIKTLIDSGYLVSRRGQYGTVVIKTSDKETMQPKPETTIFAPAAKAAIYRYTKIENQLKKMIADDFSLGSKLPSMKNLSEMLDVSTNTIKKALHNLSKQGYIGFSRGRYGGSFIINIPENQESNAFRWLAISHTYSSLRK